MYEVDTESVSARGRLPIDETDKKRSKAAKLIYKLRKIKDKVGGG